jgi:hypothetical protein
VTNRRVVYTGDQRFNEKTLDPYFTSMYNECFF